MILMSYRGDSHRYLPWIVAAVVLAVAAVLLAVLG